ncbi:unnamed protein product [Oppiella nova]|uniref:Serine carboxypeptidase n=1 Tax=Oppiella nova TaxID=334625 RepID=A0A7R9MLA3_9ACAR|nr:unnamed protein product [Oppiella nova]CAG2179155.1 unnamed protein product [Oppiella nova]
MNAISITLQMKRFKCGSVQEESVSPPNPYNIYDDCGANSAYIRLYNRYYAKKLNKKPIRERSNDNYNCPHDGYEDYLNLPQVRKALHVRTEDTHKWSDCGGEYEGTITGQRKVINELLNTYKIGKIVIFNGNFDTVCDFIDNQRFVDSLGLTKVSPYSSWTTPDGSVAGFVQHYEKNLSFVLVRGAGHMVPHDKPEPALQLLKNIVGITQF